jgi:hypothetical protein
MVWDTSRITQGHQKSRGKTFSLQQMNSDRSDRLFSGGRVVLSGFWARQTTVLALDHYLCSLSQVLDRKRPGLAENNFNDGKINSSQSIF